MMMEEIIKPIYLLIEELNYELRIRGVNTTRDIPAKRKILGRAFDKERFRPLDLTDPDFNFESEQEAINNTLESVNSLILEFEGPTSDSLYKRIKSRLIHVTNRVKRMQIPENASEEIKTYKNESYATCLEYEANLQERVTEERPLLNLDTPIAEHSVLVQSPAPIAAKAIPVYKWNVKFDGDCRSFGVNAFLERVTELAQARGVNKNELFSSAIDLFSGKALIWYRSIKNSVTDWDSLVSLLKLNFLPSDYDDKLWEEIKQRSQGREEPVAIFIAVMETLFSRLARPPAEATRVKHIKQNLLPQYITQLALSEINTVSELCTLCKKLEEAQKAKNKYRPSPSVNVLEPELAYLQNPSTSFSRGPNEDQISKRKFFARPKKYENTDGKRNIVKIICWNCNQPNHTYSHCTEKRKMFCFRCGKPDTTVSKCNHSGNE